ncbi:Nif3-like dinuclear metal center hexameric protein [Nocardioides sp. InS609-2]|uniref:Nif3-like dinuclear metal center hexameric protein n=1 Tax=Nocardioides sp. InS609-2 TaxID=2760705 RepID=UPI0020C11A71|nr:Nif3-like dinuclear metal center hexameric protein [Nocardioides sp. InS609-2]
MPALTDVVDLVHGWYPPAIAAEWDRVGLTVGDPTADVRRIVLAVDPVQAIAREAIDARADLLITHHPLLLRGVSTVAATTPKGRVVHELIAAGCGLLTAHTNADAPAGGVSESLALALGLTDLRPLVPYPTERLVKLTTYVPAGDAEAMRSALAAAGAGRIGDYDSASFSSPGEGRFRPLAGARPAIGSVGRFEVVDEVRIEAVLPMAARQAVVAALLEAHPYETPAYDVVEVVGEPAADSGAGRVGRIEAVSLTDFAASVAHALPRTAHGVRVSGGRDDRIETVAVLGGAGDDHLDDARLQDVDAYVTSDLRHHPASEFREHGGPALLDISHWAAEWTWLPVLRAKLAESLGDTVEVIVSTTCTDPWDFRA